MEVGITENRYHKLRPGTNISKCGELFQSATQTVPTDLLPCAICFDNTKELEMSRCPVAKKSSLSHSPRLTKLSNVKPSQEKYPCTWCFHEREVPDKVVIFPNYGDAYHHPEDFEMIE